MPLRSLFDELSKIFGRQTVPYGRSPSRLWKSLDDMVQSIQSRASTLERLTVLVNTRIIATVPRKLGATLTDFSQLRVVHMAYLCISQLIDMTSFFPKTIEEIRLLEMLYTDLRVFDTFLKAKKSSNLPNLKRLIFEVKELGIEHNALKDWIASAASYGVEVVIWLRHLSEGIGYAPDFDGTEVTGNIIRVPTKTDRENSFSLLGAWPEYTAQMWNRTEVYDM